MRLAALNYKSENVDIWSELDEAVGNKHAHLPGTFGSLAQSIFTGKILHQLLSVLNVCYSH